MKTSQSIIEEVVKDAVGVDAQPVVDFLKGKKNISEFKIAESLKQEVNLTRNMLYRLYDNNLVTFIRKKDKVKGWYIYYWTLNLKNFPYILSELKIKKLHGLKERLKREQQSSFFVCHNGCIRLDFDQVSEFAYKCPECGVLMHEENNQEKIKEIEKGIAILEKELK